MKETLIARKVFVNPAFRDRVTVLRSVEDTHGAYMLVELEVAPGGSNFPHTHSAFEETFTAVTGVLGVMLNGKKYHLNPGESITVPLHAPHYFFNDGAEVIVCQIQFAPGHEGFIKGLAIAYGLAADGKVTKRGLPKSLVHLALLMTLTDTKPAALPGLVYPLFKWIARNARKKGIEQALLEKYYYQSGGMKRMVAAA